MADCAGKTMGNRQLRQKKDKFFSMDQETDPEKVNNICQINTEYSVMKPVIWKMTDSRIWYLED